MKVVKLFDKTGNAKSWGPQDVIDEALEYIKEGFEGDVMVLLREKHTGSYNVQFVQCGMCASEMIGLLEVAKMNIYKEFMS